MLFKSQFFNSVQYLSFTPVFLLFEYASEIPGDLGKQIVRPYPRVIVVVVFCLSYLDWSQQICISSKYLVDAGWRTKPWEPLCFAIIFFNIFPKSFQLTFKIKWRVFTLSSSQVSRLLFQIIWKKIAATK